MDVPKSPSRVCDVLQKTSDGRLAGSAGICNSCSHYTEVLGRDGIVLRLCGVGIDLALAIPIIDCTAYCVAEWVEDGLEEDNRQA